MRIITLGIVCSLCACTAGAGGTEDADPPTATRTLYIATEGLVLGPATGAESDSATNTSTLVSSVTELPRYLPQDAQRTSKIDAIVAEVADILSPYDITITTTRPPTGLYEMIVLTGARGSAIGLTDGVLSIIPTRCAGYAATIGLVLDAPANTHTISREIVQMFGSTGGIPKTAAANDCMCADYAVCGSAPQAPCTIGGPQTPVYSKDTCANATTIDVDQLFLATYGAG